MKGRSASRATPLSLDFNSGPSIEANRRGKATPTEPECAERCAPLYNNPPREAKENVSVSAIRNRQRSRLRLANSNYLSRRTARCHTLRCLRYCVPLHHEVLVGCSVRPVVAAICTFLYSFFGRLNDTVASPSEEALDDTKTRSPKYERVATARVANRMIQGICQTTIASVGGGERCQQYGFHRRASRARVHGGTQSHQYTFGHPMPLPPTKREDRTGHRGREGGRHCSRLGQVSSQTTN
jgi:hypothetical protein